MLSTTRALKHQEDISIRITESLWFVFEKLLVKPFQVSSHQLCIPQEKNSDLQYPEFVQKLVLIIS